MTETVVVPVRADAERAAAALSDAGVGRVVLFGSVARGEATERSDIDLMAIYDDLDYGERWKRRCELKELAEQAAGFSVDVSVTDRAEWRMRTTRVLTSFEGRVDRQGVVLVDRPADEDVDWGKEMVLPAGDCEEALDRLGRTRAALGELLDHLRPSPVEQGGIGVDVRARLMGRLQSGCENARTAVESAVKALIHLGADPERPPWGRDIEKLCGRLSEPHRGVLASMLEPLGTREITPRRTDAGCGRSGQDPDATPELLGEMARIACRAAVYTAGRFPADAPAASDIRVYAARIEDYLDRFAVDTGEPLRRGGPGGSEGSASGG